MREAAVDTVTPRPREGFDLDEAAPWEDVRRLKLVPASTINVKPVHWLWNNRIPLGELTLLAGREGIGKSTIAYTLAAWITTGTMKGKYLGEPRSVVVAATEDSWEHTIVPRLMAAGADLGLVYRVDVVTDGVIDGYLTLPSDISALRHAVEGVGAALVLLDPLMSRLSAQLDSHKDAEVRVALEPLTAFAKSASVAVLALIHVNKSSQTDPLNLIMGSRAFSAVARSVLFAVKSPEDDGTNLLGFEKNNLGSKDETTYRYRVVGERVAETDDGDVWTGRVDWLGKSDRSVRDVMVAMAEGGMEAMSAVDEAGGWLEDYLSSVGGAKESQIVKDAGAKAGHNARNLQRAASKLRIHVESSGFPRRTVWSLSADSQVEANGATSLETCTTVTTVATGSHTHTIYPTSPVLSGDSGDGCHSLQGIGTTGGVR
jgi:hypothetical protein